MTTSKIYPRVTVRASPAVIKITVPLGTVKGLPVGMKVIVKPQIAKGSSRKTKVTVVPHFVRRGVQVRIVIAPTQIAKASHAKTEIIVHHLNVKPLPVVTRTTVVDASQLNKVEQSNDRSTSCG
jgi:hypothetical protein